MKKGSVTFPNGAREGLLSVTPVNSTAVPMAPPNGMQPQFIVTIQPTGAMFDPPAPLTLPNVDGHKPGAEVEMYSYDHDLEEFVAIGLGTVSHDGSVIESNPGVGVIKAGWHCGSQPGGSSCASSCGDCKKCEGNCNCVADDGKRPTAMQDMEGDCKAPACRGGSATQAPNSLDRPTVVTDPEDYECKTCSSTGSIIADVTRNQSRCGDNQCGLCANGRCAVPGLSLDLTSADDFKISSVPAMPTLTAHARVTGASPDPTDQTSIRWDANISFSACGRIVYGEMFPITTMGGLQDIQFPGMIRGGTVKISGAIVGDGAQSCAETTYQYIAVTGTNPSAAEIDSVLVGSVLRAEIERKIACRESSKRQFTNGRPLLNCEPSGLMGVGVLQVTNPPATDEAYWNWQQNIREGLAILQTKYRDALTYPGRVRRTYPAAPDFTMEQLEKETIQRFNGCGAYWQWDDVGNQWSAQPCNTYVSDVLTCGS